EEHQGVGGVPTNRRVCLQPCKTFDYRQVPLRGRSTQKNRHNTPGQLEFKKICRYCRKHTTHHEIKK
uniref:50S ribosomal protein L33, chloroplastic n=1 Tax=Aegilops tauschii subsp. strangulata TaxID=200361 RepID=A0A453RUY9_AEGTS